MNLKLKWIRKGLHTNFLYSLGKAGVKIGRKGFMREAFLYTLEETRSAYTGERKTIWCSTFVPTELVYAVGGVPFMPEVAAGFTATAGLADQMLRKAEGNWLNADLCSIHRCGTGLMMENLIPEPDLIISTTHLCDGAKKYLQHISYKYNCPFYLLETPYRLEDEKWLASQISSLVNKLEPERIDFESSFSCSNQAYHYHQRVNELRRQIPAVFSGEKAMNMMPMEFMSFGSSAAVNYYRELARELKRRLSKGESVVPEERFRLLWLHLKPYYPQQIFSSLRARGAVVAFEEYSQLYWEQLDPAHPYLSLARKMINHFGWGPLQRQLDGILKLVDDYRIDGIIGFSQWGCRQNNGRMDMLKKKLRWHQVPFLNIDGDLVDNRNYREGQLLTRLQAFIELMEVQRGEEDVNSRYRCGVKDNHGGNT